MKTFLSNCLNNLHVQGCVAVVTSEATDVMLLSMQITKGCSIKQERVLWGKDAHEGREFDRASCV